MTDCKHGALGLNDCPDYPGCGCRESDAVDDLTDEQLDSLSQVASRSALLVRALNRAYHLGQKHVWAKKVAIGDKECTVRRLVEIGEMTLEAYQWETRQDPARIVS